jgi:hypothetical protein
VLGKQAAIEPGPLCDIALLIVVRNQRDPAPDLVLWLAAHVSQPGRATLRSQERRIARMFRLGQRC